MSEKIKVPADLQEICILFEDSSCEHRGYLDIKTGEIIQIFDDIMDPDEKEELDDKVEEGFGERYITIPNADSHEGYQDMEDFIETVKEVKLKEKLYNAINLLNEWGDTKLIEKFMPRMETLVDKTEDVGWGYHDILWDWYDELGISKKEE